jgi:hypothetical protein
MTDNPSGTAAENSTAEPTANSNFAVLAAIADLGDRATPAAIAQQVGIAYSTVNPKLRAWEAAGLAERFRPESGQTLWRLTDAGRASTATPPQFAATVTPAESTVTEPVVEQTANTASTPPGVAQPSAKTATEALHDDSQEPVIAVPPVAAGDDASAPAPTTVGGHLGSDITRDEEFADTALRGASEPIAGSEPATSADDEAAEPGDDHKTGTGATPDAAAPAKRDRPRGAIPKSVLAILQADPDREFKVDEMRKLIDQADEGKGFKRASHGAVANAFTNLAKQGLAESVEERDHATYRLAPAAD